jgi:hypothetical protein
MKANNIETIIQANIATKKEKILKENSELIEMMETDTKRYLALIKDEFSQNIESLGYLNSSIAERISDYNSKITSNNKKLKIIDGKYHAEYISTEIKNLSTALSTLRDYDPIFQMLYVTTTSDNDISIPKIDKKMKLEEFLLEKELDKKEYLQMRRTIRKYLGTELDAIKDKEKINKKGDIFKIKAYVEYTKVFEDKSNIGRSPKFENGQWTNINKVPTLKDFLKSTRIVKQESSFFEIYRDLENNRYNLKPFKNESEKKNAVMYMLSQMNMGGVPGVGPVIASKILQKYGFMNEAQASIIEKLYSDSKKMEFNDKIKELGNTLLSYIDACEKKYPLERKFPTY